MNEMVERVARALWMERYNGPPWEDEESDMREIYYGRASAAIAAMREPTEEMMTAGGERLGTTNYYAGQCWKAMADAALKAPSPAS